MDAESICRVGEDPARAGEVLRRRRAVVIPMQITARDKQTGNSAAFMFTTLAELQGGVIVRIRNYAITPRPSKPPGFRSSPSLI